MRLDQAIEKRIQQLDLNAPRVTPDHIHSKVVRNQFHVFEGSCTTVCMITLENGYTVIGQSACASPENFNEQLGRDLAFENAVQKIWALEGYLLKERLYQEAIA